MLGMPCWCALVKTKKEEAENEDNKEMYQAVGLKEDVIEKRRKLAGAAIVYEDTKSLKDSEFLIGFAEQGPNCSAFP